MRDPGSAEVIEPDSDGEPLAFSDVEEVLLDMDLSPWADNIREAPDEALRIFQQNRLQLYALEQAAKTSMQRHLTACGALALVYGRR